MQDRDCSFKMQTDVAAVFVKTCVLEIHEAALCPLKAFSLRSALSTKPCDAACEEAVPQPELRKGFTSDHCFIVSICKINHSQKTKKDAVSVLSHCNSLGRHLSWQRNSCFPLLLLSTFRAGNKYREVTRMGLLITRSPHSASTPSWVVGQHTTPWVKQSNILWRTVVTAKRVKITLTLFFFPP